jgi:glycerophosphoryl diester phosphodiesterase
MFGLPLLLLTEGSMPTPEPHRDVLVIAHRGASGYRPEHTLAAYELAIDQGADYIEPDLVMTRDGVLIARHENEIGSTTDAAERFPERRATKVIDGDTMTGWFAEDFTLAEIRSLRARERLSFRSKAWDGRFGVPTFEEVLLLIRRKEAESGRRIGVYPETKHPSYHRSLGLALDDTLLAVLARHGYTGREDPVFIQSFETGNLRALRARTAIRLVQLLGAEGAPWDLVEAGDARTYADLATPDGLREIARYADVIGPHKELIQPVGPGGVLLAPTSLVRDAHAAGLRVHAWTFRAEGFYLPAAYGGDPGAELRRFADLGVDGVFTDFPDLAVRALGR